MDSLTKFFNDSLTDLEKSKIEAFTKDEVMLNAVKKVLLQGIYTQGTIQKGYDINPKINGAFALASLSLQNPIPDEEIGRHLRAMWAGVNYLENAFTTLNSLKLEVESPYNEENEAI